MLGVQTLSRVALRQLMLRLKEAYSDARNIIRGLGAGYTQEWPWYFLIALVMAIVFTRVQEHSEFRHLRDEGSVLNTAS
jgi:hypothetical protein